MTRELFEFDKAFLPARVAGCDEAGRGALAGPVVIAACFMPLDICIDGINDSKQLSALRREEFYGKIVSRAFCYSSAVIEREVIDQINILGATKRGFVNSIAGLSQNPDLILTDAVAGLDVDIDYKPIIGGDAKSYNIAAASIIAKVTRDRLMIELDALYPEYGFARNKGYGTKEHISALKKYGPCREHRALFIRNAMSQQLVFNLN